MPVQVPSRAPVLWYRLDAGPQGRVALQAALGSPAPAERVALAQAAGGSRRYRRGPDVAELSAEALRLSAIWHGQA